MRIWSFTHVKVRIINDKYYPASRDRLSLLFIELWSQENRMQLNVDKCRELVIDFKKNPHNFSPIVNGKELPVSSSAKILGVSISSNLKWNDHIVSTENVINNGLVYVWLNISNMIQMLI